VKIETQDIPYVLAIAGLGMLPVIIAVFMQMKMTDFVYLCIILVPLTLIALERTLKYAQEGRRKKEMWDRMSEEERKQYLEKEEMEMLKSMSERERKEYFEEIARAKKK
jgi:hypothetical protein